MIEKDDEDHLGLDMELARVLNIGVPAKNRILKRKTELMVKEESSLNDQFLSSLEEEESLTNVMNDDMGVDFSTNLLDEDFVSRGKNKKLKNAEETGEKEADNLSKENSEKVVKNMLTDMKLEQLLQSDSCFHWHNRLEVVHPLHQVWRDHG